MREAYGFNCQALLDDACEYLELADRTGRILRPDKRGAIDAAAPPILRRLGLRESEWSCQVKGIESHYWRAVGAWKRRKRWANVG